ncbi:hypothetical protein MMC06_000587 [Schaereria dolodes]|nr:hypothetical protein [Schaereria dolodes]
MAFKKYDIAVRVQALALAEVGVPIQIVCEITGLSRRSVYHLRKKARERGFDPQVSPTLKIEYVEDGPRPGRPKGASAEQDEGDEIPALVAKD